MEISEMTVGEYRKDVVLELINDDAMSRPRMKPVTDYPASIRVEVSRKIRELFPIGTQFKADVKVCQKHSPDGLCVGQPYLRAYDVGVLVHTIKDPGIVARLDPTGKDGRKYYYVWQNRESD